MRLKANQKSTATSWCDRYFQRIIRFARYCPADHRVSAKLLEGCVPPAIPIYCPRWGHQRFRVSDWTIGVLKYMLLFTGGNPMQKLPLPPLSQIPQMEIAREKESNEDCRLLFQKKTLHIPVILRQKKTSPWYCRKHEIFLFRELELNACTVHYRMRLNRTCAF